MAKQNNINIQNIDIAGKVPPQAMDIEEAVLGALLIEGASFDRVSLKPEYFYKDHHQKIFIAMQSLYSKNRKIDELTVTDELRKNETLDEIGGPYTLSVLSSKVSGAWNIEEHTSIVFEKFIKREFIRISNVMLNMAFDESEDSDNLLNYSYSELDKVNGEASDIDEMKTFKDILKQSIANLQHRQKLASEGKIMGIITPVAKLTSWTNGWQNEDLIIIAARPSMGKTAMALSCAKVAAFDKVPVVFFSLEMKSVRLADRILIGESNVSADDFRSGKIKNEDWVSIDNAIAKIIDLPIYFDDRPKSINKIRIKAKALKRKGKCGLIIIDYLQLSTESDNEESKKNREQEISAISRKSKLMAKELDTPVILLSQLNRALESRSDKRPILSDLRESGCLHGDTKIYCPSLKSNIAIKNLINQKEFDISTFSRKENKIATAKKCFKTGNKEVFEITLINGQSINATSNHKFFTPHGWIPVSDLENNKIALPLGIENKEYQIKDSEIRLVGYFIANGSCLKKQPLRVTLNQLDDDFAKLIMNDAIDCTNNQVMPRVILTNTPKSKFANVFFKPTFHLTHGKTSPIADIMRKHNMFDIRTKDKFVPDIFFFMSKRQICLLLSALFTGNGTVYYHETKGRKSLKISYSSASPKLIKDIQLLLLNIGIVSFVSSHQNEKNQKWQNLYIAGKANIELFVNKIGFLNNRKKETLRQGWLKAQDIKAGWNKYQYNHNRSLCFMPIKTIKSIGFHDVYDIEVNEHHNFVANGIMTHNSIEQDADMVIFIHRPERYGITEDENGNPLNGRSELIISKQREGKIGTIPFRFNESLTAVYDFDESWSNEDLKTDQQLPIF